MKIIFLKDVPGSGKRNDIKDVASGFAANYLIPNKLAVTATDIGMRRVELEKAQMMVEAKLEKDLLLKNLSSLNGSRVTILGKANEEGHLFAGIHKKEIRDQIKKELRIEIPEDSIELKEPIKTLGEVPIEVESYGRKVTFTLSVEKGK
jgi:large subunit ribosomal protein L9